MNGEAIQITRDIAITFVHWTGGLAATLETAGLAVTLAEDVTGGLRLVDWGDGDMGVTVMDECDYLSVAARLLADMGRVDDHFRTPDGEDEWVRVGQWVLTITSAGAVEHIFCSTPSEAQTLFRDWVIDTGTAGLPTQDPKETP